MFCWGWMWLACVHDEGGEISLIELKGQWSVTSPIIEEIYDESIGPPYATEYLVTYRQKITGCI